MKDLLEEVGLTPREIERVVVDRGPGLFTGLRVGIATAIAFSQALGCELVGVTSLEMLAGGAFSSGVRAHSLPASTGDDARSSCNLSSSTVTSSPRRSPRQHRSRDRGGLEGKGAPVTFTGDAWSATAVNSLPIPRDNLRPGRAVGSRGTRPGASRSPEDVVSPLYLREADAVANFTTRGANEDRVEDPTGRASRHRRTSGDRRGAVPRAVDQADTARRDREHRNAPLHGRLREKSHRGLPGRHVRPERAPHQHDRNAARRRGPGIATSLLDDAWADAKKRGITRATLEVAVSNQRAIDLYYRYGFRPVGVRKNYYEKTNEDALILWAISGPRWKNRHLRWNDGFGPRNRDEL